MNSYEKLLQKASDEKIKVFESFDLNGDCEPSERLSGLYIDGNIALDRKISTDTEKSCILAEELGHHYTSYGNILDLDDVQSRKQEYRARMMGYDIKIGLSGIICAFERGVQSKAEMADYLNVTEEYLSSALDAYRKKYGKYVSFENYTIIFEPYFAVCKAFEDFTD